jgi:Au+-exporting ATPase
MANTKQTIDVKGMHCASCVVLVEQALRTVPGVKEANVNLVTGTATITSDEHTPLHHELVDAVSSVGYEATMHHDDTPHDHAHIERTSELTALKYRVIVASVLVEVFFLFRRQDDIELTDGLNVIGVPGTGDFEGFYPAQPEEFN